MRQPIYGLLLGNALTVGLVLLLRFHDVASLPSGLAPDIGFIDEMGWLMVWGTALLYLDASSSSCSTSVSAAASERRCFHAS